MAGEEVLIISGVLNDTLNSDIENKIQRIKGVYSVRINTEHKNISITFDPGKNSADDIMTSLLDSGIFFKRYNIS